MDCSSATPSTGPNKVEDLTGRHKNLELLDSCSPGKLSRPDVENVVHEILGSSQAWPKPRRVSMHDMVKVDEASRVLLRASPVWKVLLPHVERIDEMERGGAASSEATAPANFVARTFLQRPEIVYAVRYGFLG